MLLTEGGLEPGTFGYRAQHRQLGHRWAYFPQARRGRAGQGRAGQGRAGQGRAGQGRAGQGRAGQGRAGQGRAGQGRAGQGRAGQGRAALPSAYTLLLQKERKERAGGHRGLGFRV